MGNEPLQELLEFVQNNGRVCPMPRRWDALWKMLPDRNREEDGSWSPPMPLILAAWNYAEDGDKAKRLRDHICWAAEKGSLVQIGNYLRNLSEDDWHHVGD
jgi:hypothetical protein